MKLKLQRITQTEQIPADSLYVAQDNYEIVNLKKNPNNWKYLYCDSATSCIIVIVTGTNLRAEPQVAITHLSRPERFAKFWEIIRTEFGGKIHVFAHGANPPEPGIKNGSNDYTALRNAGIVMDFILFHTMEPVQKECQKETDMPVIQIEQVTLIFGEGNPGDYDSNLDCYGIDLADPGNLVVSNRRLYLTPKDRDQSGGLQSLFCSYGMKLNQPMVLIRATEAFDSTNREGLEANKTLLVNAAHADNYEAYEYMSDPEILAQCSSTPDAEVPWFCDTIRESAKYVRENL